MCRMEITYTKIYTQFFIYTHLFISLGIQFSCQNDIIFFQQLSSLVQIIFIMIYLNKHKYKARYKLFMLIARMQL